MKLNEIKLNVFFLKKHMLTPSISVSEDDIFTITPLA